MHNLSGGVAHWIALNDAEGPEGHHVEGVFKWDYDFKPMNYQNWQEGEPNNKNHLDCVASNEMGWFMVVSGCARAKLPYVCKKTTATAGKLLSYYRSPQPSYPLEHLQQWNNSISNSWMLPLTLLIILLLLLCIVQCNGRDVIK